MVLYILKMFVNNISEGCFPTQPPSLTPPFWHSPILGHQAFPGPRASPPIDVQQGHPLLHMQLNPWVLPCVLFGWWFSAWELWELWLVDIVVLPMGCKPLQLLQSFLQLLHWGACAQSNGWLWGYGSVFVMPWQGSRSGWVGERGRRMRWGFSEAKLGKGITFEM